MLSALPMCTANKLATFSSHDLFRVEPQVEKLCTSFVQSNIAGIPRMSSVTIFQSITSFFRQIFYSNLTFRSP